MANLPTESEGRAPSPLRDENALVRALGIFDDWLFRLEKGLVTAMLAIMTVSITLKIVNDFFDKQLIAVRGQAPNATAEAGAATLAFVALTFFVSFAVATAKSERFSESKPAQLGVALGATVFGLAWCYGVSELSPSIACAITIVLIAVWLITDHLADEEPTVATPAFIGVTVAVSALLIFTTRGFETYAWASNVALTLLMWMAFFGASMATYDHRHLRIDAVRKAVPEDKQRLFSAISYLVTTIATFGLLYLAYNYFVLRLDDAVEPGKIPSYWRVASIPFALLIITVRFASYGIAEFMMWQQGVPPEQPAPISEPAATEAAQ